MGLMKRVILVIFMIFPLCLQAMSGAGEEQEGLINRFPSLNSSGFIRPDITNFSSELPDVQQNVIRFASYNILASFFTDVSELDQINNFSASETHHTWAVRQKSLINLLTRVSPSICNLQEVSFRQYKDILEGLKKQDKPYGAVGHIPHTNRKLPDVSELNEYEDFNTIILYDTTIWDLKKNSLFWLKEESDTPPSINEEHKTATSGEGFGNDDHRKVEWVVLAAKPNCGLPEGLKALILTSHFSLLASRSKCAGLIIDRLQKLIHTELTNIENSIVMVSGDFNLFPNEEGVKAYKSLASMLKDHRDAPEHFGFAATFIGAKNDKFHSVIDETGNINPNALDFMGFNQQVNLVRSFCLAGEFDLSKGELLTPLVSPMRTDRVTTSDHCLIGADVKVKVFE